MIPIPPSRRRIDRHWRRIWIVAFVQREDFSARVSPGNRPGLDAGCARRGVVGLGHGRVSSLSRSRCELVVALGRC